MGLLSTRRNSLLLLAGSLAAVLAGLFLPAGEIRISRVDSLIDSFAPVFQFHEIHETEVRAAPDQVYAAIRLVTPGEIALFRELTWIRRLGQGGKPNILNAPESAPLLDTALRGGFLLLAQQPGREIVIGAVLGPVSSGPGALRPVAGLPPPQRFQALQTVKAAMNFRVISLPGGHCRLITETRITAYSAFGRRAFATYWRLIYPGSAVIRRMWLRAIRRRAESHSALPFAIPAYTPFTALR